MLPFFETKPRKAKFGFRYNIRIHGTLMERAERARELAHVFELVHATLGEPMSHNELWWHETPNRNGSSDEFLIYINEVELYEKFKSAIHILA